MAEALDWVNHGSQMAVILDVFQCAGVIMYILDFMAATDPTQIPHSTMEHCIGVCKEFRS
jgi:hypothetical protein